MDKCICSLYQHRKLPVDFLDRYFVSAANPSIFYDKDSDLFYILVRNTNYKLKKNKLGGTECTPVKAAKNTFETRNFITVCRNPIEDNLQWYLIKETKRQFYSNKHGMEDCRLIKWRNKFYLSGTLRDWNTAGMGRICLMELNNRWEEVNHFILEGTCKDGSFCEKNYQPILDKPYHYVVSNNPVVVNRYSLSDLRATYLKGTSGMCIGTGMLGSYRGSSQAVPYKDGYISIVHHSEVDKKTQHHYWHHVVRYDKDFNVLDISKPFKFEGGTVEFCCGLAIKDEYAYITYSVMDTGASIVKVPVAYLAGENGPFIP